MYYFRNWKTNSRLLLHRSLHDSVSRRAEVRSAGCVEGASQNAAESEGRHGHGKASKAACGHQEGSGRRELKASRSFADLIYDKVIAEVGLDKKGKNWPAPKTIKNEIELMRKEGVAK